MPIYEFACGACGARFEELTRADETPPCPSCGARDGVERQISMPAPTPKIGLRGRDARRSEAQRYDKRERAREAKSATRKDA
ncbi:MAG TPA: zinc ribbon domain-containing protein [Thermoleophilaceae bacterium]|nr:zinc ribbon domain-containing protein [Thermoleophilaceae bacterium]